MPARDVLKEMLGVLPHEGASPPKKPLEHLEEADALAKEHLEHRDGAGSLGGSSGGREAGEAGVLGACAFLVAWALPVPKGRIRCVVQRHLRGAARRNQPGNGRCARVHRYDAGSDGAPAEASPPKGRFTGSPSDPSYVEAFVSEVLSNVVD